MGFALCSVLVQLQIVWNARSDKHRALKGEQFEISSDSHGQLLLFSGRSTKNFQRGLAQRKIQRKNLKIYSNCDELQDRCVVDLHLHYLLIPETGNFYWKPLGDKLPRFCNNKLAGLVKEMCAKAGFVGSYRNHSGKATCATELFNQNVDEQLTMRQTGNRSNFCTVVQKAWCQS